MKTHWTSMGLGALAISALISSGCSRMGASTSNEPVGATTSGSKSSATDTASATPARSAVKLPSLVGKVNPSGDKGAIVGYVAYHGTPPKPKPINFGPEKVCADLNRSGPALYETLVVNPNSTIKGTVVAIRGKVAGDYAPPSQPAVIDQVGCIFTPHVLGVMVRQEIELRNSDPVSHNIRGTATRNQTFNSVFASKMSSKIKFEEPELNIPVKCDIHFWMSGYIHVSPHPFFAVTGDDGSFIIPDVPPGKYTLLAWHETLKTQTQPITIKPGEVTEVEFAWPKGQ